MARRNLFVVLLLGLLLLAVGLPVFGQDVTPEPTPVVIITDPPAEPVGAATGQLFTTAIIVIGAVASIALVVFGAIVRPILAAALASMPQWGADMLFGAVETGLESAANYAKTTDTPRDDAGVEQLKADIRLLREDVQRLRDLNSRPPSG